MMNMDVELNKRKIHDGSFAGIFYSFHKVFEFLPIVM